MMMQAIFDWTESGHAMRILAITVAGIALAIFIVFTLPDRGLSLAIIVAAITIAWAWIFITTSKQISEFEDDQAEFAKEIAELGQDMEKVRKSAIQLNEPP